MLINIDPQGESMDFKEKVAELDAALVLKWDEYIQLDKQLEPLRGLPLEATNLEEANRIIKEMQVVFSEMYPMLFWISQRNESSINAINSYNTFIDSIKRNGATQVEEGQA